MSDHWATRATLIRRASDSKDEQAWTDFVNVYSKFIQVVLRELGVYQDHLDDLTQDILIKVWKYLKSYDPKTHNVRFRTWLSTLIRNQVYDFWTSQKKVREREAELERPIPEIDQLERVVQDEWESHLTSTALENLRPRFTGSAVKAFELSLVGYSTEAIAEALKLTPASVRTLRSRVRNRMIEEVQRLKEEMEV